MNFKKRLCIAGCLIAVCSAGYATMDSPFPTTVFSQQEIVSEISQCRSELSKHASANDDVLKMFDVTAAEWQDHYFQSRGAFDIRALLKAVVFAAKKHEGQFRDGPSKTPYIFHPISVAHILWAEGKVRSTNVLVAALLHDTLEDTETTSEEIEQLFGPRVRYTVEEVTNDPHLGSQENKQRQVDHAPYLSLNAQLVKLTDRLHNIRELRIPLENWNKNRVSTYIQWGQKLLNALRGTNAFLEDALQKEILEQSEVNEGNVGS